MRSIPWWAWVGAGLAMVAYWSNKAAEQKRKQQAQAAKSPQIPVINPLPGQSVQQATSDRPAGRRPGARFPGGGARVDPSI